MTFCLLFEIDDKTGSIFPSVSFNASAAVAMSLTERYKIGDSAANSYCFLF